jgi:hypothetical protein
MHVREPIYTRAVGRWKNYASMLEPFFEAAARHAVAFE